MSVTFEIEPSEWGLVGRLASALRLDEANGEAIWLVASPGVRRWIARDGDGVVVEALIPSPDGETYELGLSPRLVWSADDIARRDGDCTLSIVDGRTSTASGRTTSTAVDLIDGGPPSVPPVATGPAATVPAKQLAHLLDAASCLPRGVDLTDVEPPAMWLAIQPGGVSVHVDWTPFGVARATYSTAATTAGNAVVAVVPSVLRRLLTDNLDEDEMVTVTVTPNGSQLVVETASWRILTPTVDATVSRFAPRIDVILENAGLARHWVSPRVVTFGGPREIRAELHPTTPEIVRLSSIIAAGVPDDPDVLSEINQLNAGLVAVRVWVESGQLVAAVDLPCSRLTEIIDTAAHLLREVQGLDTFVVGLAGVE